MAKKSDQEDYNKLLRYASYRERSSGEVLHKGRRLGISDSNMQKLLSRLQEDGYVDDERYARSYVRGKFRINGWGRIKIRNKLFEKGIGEELINEALCELDEEDYSEMIRKLLEKKLEDDDTETGRQKAFHSIASRGFEFDLVNVHLNKLIRELKK